MRRVRGLVVAVLLVAGCGDAGDRVPDAASPTGTSAAAPTIAGSVAEPAPSSTTTAPTTGASAPVTPPSTEDAATDPTIPTTATSTVTSTTTSTVDRETTTAILRPGGIATVDFGTPADEAIAELDAILGPPAHDRTIDPDDLECVEGSGWVECLEVIEHARLLTWTASGLEVLITDAPAPDGQPPRAVAPYFGAWRATRPTGEGPLTTDDGLGPGAPVEELERRHPDVEYHYDEGIITGFTITSPAGTYRGELDWREDSPANDWQELVAVVQQALNDHGAALAVDGDWGPLSQAAWEAFWREQDLGPAPSTMWLTPESGEALGLPPVDFVVASLAARRFEPLPDTTPPALRVVDPARDAWVATAHYRFTGWTEPGADVIAAGRYPVAVDEAGRWSIVLVLVPGRNVATFEATDAAGNSTLVRLPVHLQIPFADLIVGTWRGEVTVPSGWSPIDGFWAEFRADRTYSAGAGETPAFYYGTDDECPDKTYEVWGRWPAEQPGSGTITIVFDCGPDPPLNARQGTLRGIRFSDDHERLHFEFWNTWKGSYGPVVYDLVRVVTTG